jgi:hypothetical protein
MDWDAVGAVAEAIGALAVVLTLIYLSVQMRQNSKLLQASLATATRESTNQVTGLLASDREALRVFYAGVSGRAALDELDKQHFDAIVSLYLEALLQSYQQDWDDGLQRADWMLKQPGLQEFWNEYSGLYESGFRAYISEHMRDLVDANS